MLDQSRFSGSRAVRCWAVKLGHDGPLATGRLVVPAAALADAWPIPVAGKIARPMQTADSRQAQRGRNITARPPSRGFDAAQKL